MGQPPQVPELMGQRPAVTLSHREKVSVEASIDESRCLRNQRPSAYLPVLGDAKHFHAAALALVMPP